MKVLAFNGWAAGPETWRLVSFERDWTFDYVEQLDGLAERVFNEFDETLLVGFSMGGSTALGLYLRAPEKVRGLVLVSATARMMEERATGWVGMSERRLQALALGTEMFFADDSSPVYERTARARGIEFLRVTDLRAALLASRDAGFADGLPVEILQSERDGIVRPANADFLKAAFPAANVTRVPGAEHVLPVTAPELVDAAVARVQQAILKTNTKKGTKAK